MGFWLKLFGKKDEDKPADDNTQQSAPMATDESTNLADEGTSTEDSAEEVEEETPAEEAPAEEEKKEQL